MKNNDRLAKVVALGKKRYILLHGMLGWGLLTASLFTILSFSPREIVPTAGFIVTFVVSTFIVFPICGILWGAWWWSVLKKKHDAVREQGSQ